ncbi:Amino-acid acetyltransferase, mitochondrial [Diaporthe australafricana]|uniref:Amino-acid acetyltransferase, mitochondrial n=1 Tax=Diaporthe australafricana TaxID=127596 RepID=A0ABR3XL73_9PEZI
MILRNSAWRKKATALVEISTRAKSSSSKNTAASATSSFRVASPKDEFSKDILKEHYASIPKKAQEKRSQDRDLYVSVLESSSATKRDAKQYLQTFAPTVAKNPASAASAEAVGAINVDPLRNGARAISETPRFVQGSVTTKRAPVDAVPHAALIKFRLPQEADEDTLKGVAKTLAQLRVLGLVSVIVLDCELGPDVKYWSRSLNQQAYRLAGAIDEYGEPWTTVMMDFPLSTQPTSPGIQTSPLTSNTTVVGEGSSILAALNKGSAIIVPPIVQQYGGNSQPIDPDQVVLSLTRYLSGLQLARPSGPGGEYEEGLTLPAKKAFVDRVIILDPVGGIPAKNRWNNAHVFLNLEDEVETAKTHLRSLDSTRQTEKDNDSARAHMRNLDLAKDTLAILPSTSSVLITTPREAANLHSRSEDAYEGGVMGFVGTVGTRRSHNPLIHNLLTDRPTHSSSLPLGRIKPISRNADPTSNPVMSPTTLAKRGMPVTIYPDPASAGWTPPKPGRPRLRLTDSCIDMPRLVHLIEDSFNRKLDVQHYLNRVEKSLAGIIIAGEYEGGAILTWERPFSMDEETAYNSRRLVPYLDKFAVLKKSQGAGGVADIVFNAMVRDCFPEGVCWRSRKNNPVNKWYFERSRGTMKLPESDWSMFWTTPRVTLRDEMMNDYEDVCRKILPSWADNKHIVD